MAEIHSTAHWKPVQNERGCLKIVSGTTLALLCTAVALAILCGLKVFPGGVGGAGAITAAVFSGGAGILGLVSLCCCKIQKFVVREKGIHEESLPLLKIPDTPPVQTEGESLFENEKMQDVLSTVFRKYLPAQDVNSCRSVCKKWHGVVKREPALSHKVANYLALHRYYPTADTSEIHTRLYLVQAFLKWNDCRTALKIAHQIPFGDIKIQAGLEIAKVLYRQGYKAEARAYADQIRKSSYHRVDCARLDLELKNYQAIWDVLSHERNPLMLSLLEEIVEADLPPQEKERFQELYPWIRRHIGRSGYELRTKEAYIEWHLGYLYHRIVQEARPETYTYIAYRLSAYVAQNPQSNAAFQMFTRFIEEVGQWPSDGGEKDTIRMLCHWIYLHRCVALRKREEAERVRASYPGCYTTLLMAPLEPLQPAFWEASKAVYRPELAAAHTPERVAWAQEILAKNHREYACFVPSFQFYSYPLPFSMEMHGPRSLQTTFNFCLERLKLLCCQEGVTGGEIQEATQEVLLIAATIGPARWPEACFKLADHEASRGYRERAKALLDQAEKHIFRRRAHGDSFQEIGLFYRYRAFGYHKEAERVFSRLGYAVQTSYIASFDPPQKPFYEIS